MRSESTAVFLRVNRLRPKWFFQTFDTLNVTFPLSQTQSSAPKGSPQVQPRIREKEGKKVPGKMEQERQWRAKRLAHVRLRRGREALQTLCGTCRRQERVVYCRIVLKLDNIKKHEQTQSHIRSSEIAFAILAPDKTAGQQLQQQLTAAQALKMSTMFRTSHALVLAKHFKPVVQSRLEVGKLNDEWTSLKADVYSGRDWEKTLSTLDWSEINRLYSSYSSLLSLMDLVLTLPVSTAECERGFSWLK